MQLGSVRGAVVERYRHRRAVDRRSLFSRKCLRQLLVTQAPRELLGRDFQKCGSGRHNNNGQTRRWSGGCCRLGCCRLGCCRRARTGTCRHQYRYERETDRSHGSVVGRRRMTLCRETAQIPSLRARTMSIVGSGPRPIGSSRTSTTNDARPSAANNPATLCSGSLGLP